MENLKNDLNEKIRLINAEKIKLKAEYYELSKLLSIASKKSQLAYKKIFNKRKRIWIIKSKLFRCYRRIQQVFISWNWKQES